MNTSISETDTALEPGFERPIRPQLRSALTLSGLFLLALLVQLIAFNRKCGPYDEFLSLYGADRVLQGDLPYRDFWTMYGPAQFYTLAVFFKLFGASILTGRFYDALIRAGIACACYSLARLLAPLRWAIIAFAAVLLWLSCIYYPAYNFPVYPAMLASLISCLFFSRFLREHFSSASLFLSGLFVSIATVFRHDSGFYICFAELLILFWITVQSRLKGEPLSPLSRGLSRRVLLFFAGVSLIAAPVYAVALLRVGFQKIFYDLFYVPGVIYPRVRSLPFLPHETIQQLHHPLSWDGRLAIESLIVFFPIFAILSAFLCLLTTRRSRIFPANWQRQTFSLLLLLASLFFVKGLIRVGPVQLIQSVIVCIVVIVILFSYLPRLSRLNAAALYTTASFFTFCSLPVLSHFIGFTRVNFRDATHAQAEDSLYRRCHPPAGLERARCILITPDVASAVQDIEHRSSPGQPIYIGNGRHDRIFWNDVRLYFLSGRPSITRWYDLHPGIQTTRPIQNEIIQAIERNHPPVVALNYTWDDTIEPNQSQYSSGVTALDDYLRSHYIPQASYGKIIILAPSR